MYTCLLNTRYVNAYLHMCVYMYLSVHRECVSARWSYYIFMQMYKCTVSAIEGTS